MLNILAIETSSRLCQIAVHSNGNTISRHEDTASHSHLILTLIQQALHDSAISIEQLDYIAVTRGPGSFTGLRVGITVAQGLSFAHAIPVIPLSSLQLTAWEWARAAGVTCAEVAVMATLDARMSQLYAGWYIAEQASLENNPLDNALYPVATEHVVSPERLHEMGVPHRSNGSIALRTQSTPALDKQSPDIARIIVGSGLAYASALDSQFASQCEFYPDVAVSAEGMVDWIVRHSPEKLRDIFVDPQDLAPVYIRDNVVG